MSRKLIATVAVCCAALVAAPAVAAPAGKGKGKSAGGGVAQKKAAKRVKPRAIATKECTLQLQQMGASTFKLTYGSLQGCVDEIIDEARIAVAQAIEECLQGNRAYGKCIFRRALAILQDLLGEPPPPPPPPPPPELTCPIDLSSSEAGLADLVFPDLSGETLSPELAQQVQSFQALQAELAELLALLAGQTGPLGQMLLDQLNFIEQQLRAILPAIQDQLNAELCPAA